MNNMDMSSAEPRCARFRFDQVGQCHGTATVMVEGYSPKDGRAHGSLDVTVHVCSGCHERVRRELWTCGMTPYSIQSAAMRTCGERTIFDDNEYARMYTS